MYYPDLSGYEYVLPKRLADVLNVGWLERGRPYKKGPFPDQLLAKLARLSARYRTRVMRGFHFCDLCDALPHEWVELPIGRLSIPRQARVESSMGQVDLGDAELWLPSANGNVIFAAPNLICHYVAVHEYLPPEPFVEAVQSFSENAEWFPDQEYERRALPLFKAAH